MLKNFAKSFHNNDLQASSVQLHGILIAHICIDISLCSYERQ